MKTLSALQNELRRLDMNGWLTLTDEEQEDPTALAAAIEIILSNP